MMFLLKKFIAFFIAGMLPFASILYSVFVFGGNLISLVVCGLCGLIAGILVGFILIDCPWIAVMEGRGLACLELNSTGMANFYLTTTNLPYMIVNAARGKISTLFNRSLSMYIRKEPLPMKMEDKGENITFTMPKSDVSESTFKIYGMPFFIFNSKINSFVSKEMLANQENKIMTEHLALELKERSKEMIARLQDQGRSVMDMLRPSSFLEFVSQPYVLAIIIALSLLILLFMFMPKIMPVLNQFLGNLNLFGSASLPPPPPPSGGVHQVQQATI